MKKLTSFFFAFPVAIFAQVPFMLKDITAGSAGSTIGELYLRPTNEVIFFAASQATPSSGGMYRTDGSVAGTYKLSNVISAGSFAGLGTHTYFCATSAGYCLHKTNGQVSGTDSIVTPALMSASDVKTIGQKM